MYLVFLLVSCTSPDPVADRSTAPPGRAARLASAWTAPGTVRAIAGAGDLDGDGYDDVAVGVSDDGGEVRVYLGSASGLGTSASVTLTPPVALGRFGGALDGVGDVDGDGYLDLVVGDGPVNQVYLYLGGAGGLGTTPAWTASGVEGGHLGSRVSRAGDVNGDGFADFMGGDPAYGYFDCTHGCSRSGRVVVWAGGASGSISELFTDARRGGSEGDRLDDAGDLDGDGLDDVIVGAPGAPGHSGGAAAVLLGSGAVWDVPQRRSGRIPYSVAGVGDVDGDGHPDVLVGVLGAGWAEDATILYLWGADARPRSGESLRDGDGCRAGAAGDVNGDGLADALVTVDECDTHLYLAHGGSLVDTGIELGDRRGDVGPLGDIDGDGLADFYVASDVYLGSQFSDADGDGVVGPADCDDGDPLVGGGTTEVCNGADDDCDGLVDEDWIGVTVYPDADGDGYGESSGVILCEDAVPGTTYAAFSADCDDSRADVHPHRHDVPGDGLDSNCNGVD